MRIITIISANTAEDSSLIVCQDFFIFLYSVGDIPIFCLKALLKVLMLSKPTMREISVIVKSPDLIRRAAFSERTLPR